MATSSELIKLILHAQAMSKIDDDSSLTQLATAWLNIALVRTKCSHKLTRMSLRIRFDPD